MDRLTQAHPGARLHGPPDLEVSGLSYDSRRVRRGHLFAALRGVKQDGLQFVKAAKRKGAVAVLSDRTPPLDMPWIEASNPRAALADLASAYFDRPADHLRLAGITGTNGKTTTAYLIEAALRKASKVTGLLGTVETRIAGRPKDSSLTTPESLDLQQLLREMVDEGVSHAVLEVSSHALVQERVRGLRCHAAVFTNLTRDHLDFHGDFDAYFEAKRRLFVDHLHPEGFAIVNLDDEHGGRLAESLRGPRCRTFGFTPEAHYRPQKMDISLQGVRFVCVTPNGEVPVHSPLVGLFNVSNLLGAIGALCALGLTPAEAASGVSSLEGVPGRMERIDVGQPFSVIVDFAHTDDALRNLLDTIRSLGPRRIITVFGCGGDRDRSKRPLMGSVAAQRSDLVIATSDNPRTESPGSILDEVAQGFKNHTTPFKLVVNRREAIELALRSASADDLVVIAGKGHETTQTIRGKKLPFDDRLVAKEILRGFGSEGGGTHAHP
ncbi:MAG: UDP-N-acetylmuramoyl-L-alanyl-D-glutamate--2,6-diaminopimelate ligase [Vicinamibacteria bacterium]|nr:UDP-N-acetylmuramoyl-L-alanyl-D-glutamate--2,6-diaminopimelate ligase [Vicinamibacteria bacterium]